MAPSFYLNETCVSYATQNYTVLLPTSELAETCAIDPWHMTGKQKAMLALLILKGLLLVLRITVDCHGWGRKSAIKSLRKKPAYELHDELEYQYALNFGGMSNIDGRAGRIKDVKYTTDHATKERVITVVENLGRAPTNSGGGERARRARTARSTWAAPGGSNTIRNGTGSGNHAGVVRPWNSTADAASSATWPTATNNERPLPTTSALGSTQPTTSYVGSTSPTNVAQIASANDELESILSPPPPAYSKHTFGRDV